MYICGYNLFHDSTFNQSLMPHFINIPTEQTTAATDVMLAILAFVVARKVYRYGRYTDLKKTRIWVWAFALLSFAAFTGSIAHGFEMSKLNNFILWQPLNLALGVAISLFVVGVVYDLLNFSLPRTLIPALLVLATIFYTITVLIPGSFIVFIIYEAIAMLFSFTVYVFLESRKKVKGAGFMASGILVTIIAAAIQAIETIKVTVIWQIDHNGIFHIVQMIGLLFLLFGLRAEFRSRIIKKVLPEKE